MERRSPSPRFTELNINPKLATASPEIGKEMDGWVDGGLGAGKIKPET